MTTAPGGGRVLVVDDSLVNRAVLSQALAAEGHEALTAENGLRALEMLRADSGAAIDAVLLDLEMPELDGFATLEQLKADANLRHLPVIVISSVEDFDSVVRCIEIGAADYLPKPFNAALLRARVNASLTEKRLNDQRRAVADVLRAVASSRGLQPVLDEIVAAARRLCRGDHSQLYLLAGDVLRLHAESVDAASDTVVHRRPDGQPRARPHQRGRPDGCGSLGGADSRRARGRRIPHHHPAQRAFPRAAGRADPAR